MKTLELTQKEIEYLTRIVFGVESTAAPCEVGFLFGSTHPEAVDATAAAYREGLFQYLIVTGGYKPSRQTHPAWEYGLSTEAEAIVPQLIKLGIPQKRIFEEHRSTNSYENVHYGFSAYPFGCPNSVLAICKTYAFGRQSRTLSKYLGSDARIVPYTYRTQLRGTGPYVDRDSWVSDSEVTVVVATHFEKIVRYGQMGHLTELDHVDLTLLRKISAYIESIAC